jgi:S1-C subfamily serine protease
VSKRIQFVAANHANLSSGYLGVFFGVEELDMPETTVFLRGVVPGSPAESGGLEPGDILARIDGRPVRSPRQAVQLLRNLGPNDRVKVDLVRDGQVQRRTVTLGKRLADPAPIDEIVRFQLPRIREVALERLRVNPMPAVPSGLDADPTMGVFLRNAAAPLREAMGWKGSESTLIALVLPGFPASVAGLQAGDLLLDIDGRPVTQVSDVSSVLRSRQKGQTVPIRYFRQGRIRTATVTLR